MGCDRLVRGYAFAKDQYVHVIEEELRTREENDTTKGTMADQTLRGDLAKPIGFLIWS